jgi:hypothetical protein
MTAEEARALIPGNRIYCFSDYNAVKQVTVTSVQTWKRKYPDRVVVNTKFGMYDYWHFENAGKYMDELVVPVSDWREPGYVSWEDMDPLRHERVAEADRKLRDAGF